mmetsp:Transcript_4351/g.11028  ORF Transcript_4351/g.11028 Transcript_4351/m.11028 type:complete len:185 (+) Transcript_4351:667-1221(+)
MSAFSGGRFTTHEILRTEKRIIETLRWYLNPPTSSMFLIVAYPLIDAIAAAVSGDDDDENPPMQAAAAAASSCSCVDDIKEFSRYLLELSVCDGYFIDKDPSSIAYASILVAMDYLATPTKMRRNFESLYRRHRLDGSPHITVLCAERLYHVYDNLLMPITDWCSEEQHGKPCRVQTSPRTVIK